MHQFVGDEAATAVSVGLVLACAKYDIAPYRVGTRTHRRGRSRGRFARMDSHVRELSVKSALHEILRIRIQRTA